MRDVSLLIASLIGDARRGITKEPTPGDDGGRMSQETLVGASPAAVNMRRTMEALLEAEAQAGPNAAAATVLLSGEAGSGRRRVARTLHELGPRRTGPFVELDCWGCPAELIEAVLFGDVGAADHLPRAPGTSSMIEQAQGGTLFLDGIETMPLAAQERLMHLIEHRLLRPIGVQHGIPVDVRAIVATREPLKPLLLQGRIKPALYYRLRTVMMDIPPLRDRGADVLLLARHFLACNQRSDRPDLRLSEAAQEQMLAHAWPGNVRELRSLIEHAALNAPASLIDHLPIGQHTPIDAPAPRDSPGYEEVARTLAWTRGDAVRAGRLLGIDQAQVLTLLHAGRRASSRLPEQAPPAA
jgi:DNA-binding NtrC family response regulator